MVFVIQKYDPKMLQNLHLNKNSIEAQMKNILNSYLISDENLTAWLLTAVTLIDLTTLSGDDTASNVRRLCVRAANPLSPSLTENFKSSGDDKENSKHLPEHLHKVQTAAVCVYPSRVKDAHSTIKRMELLQQLQIASVATGFPSGLYPLHTRLEEIKHTVSMGATEIDVVLDRSLVLTGKWEALYAEVAEMKKACGNAHLKVILGVGELGSYENVYAASMTSMFAGADFIKTSTGKEAVNATLPVGLVMCRAIRRYYQMTGVKVGLKPAGGIKTSKDAVNWLVLVYNELGAEWLTPKLFRIGASSLLDVLEADLLKMVSKQ